MYYSYTGGVSLTETLGDRFLFWFMLSVFGVAGLGTVAVLLMLALARV